MISLSGRSLKFLSTPSARRATKNLGRAIVRQFISIHALREEGDRAFMHRESSTYTISIHALREEGDPSSSTLSIRPQNFYPRPPRGGRPSGVGTYRPSSFNFYPRPPRGGRRRPRGHEAAPNQISIHALREEGDFSIDKVLRTKIISIHALREEGDLLDTPFFYFFTNFYPRPPRGGRPHFL